MPVLKLYVEEPLTVVSAADEVEVEGDPDTDEDEEDEDDEDDEG